MRLRIAAGRLALAGLATAGLVFGSALTGHADEGWVITLFHSDIGIAPSLR